MFGGPKTEGQGNIVADNDEFDTEHDENTGGSGKGLRAQLETALAEIKALKESNATLSSRVRSTDLADLLKSNKARAGAEKLYPKDAEVSEDAVKAWVEENKAFVLDEAALEGEEQEVSEETRANARKLGMLSDVANSRGNDVQSVIDRMKSAKTPEELSAIYAEIGLKRS